MAQIVLGPSRAYPNVPTVGDDLQSHTGALNAIIEALNIHERRIGGSVLDSFVRVSELETLGLANIDGNIVTDASTEESTTHHHDSTYLRLDGTNDPVTGSVSFSGGLSATGLTAGAAIDFTGATSFDASGITIDFTGTVLTGPVSATGAWTFSSTIDISSASYNFDVYVDESWGMLRIEADNGWNNEYGIWLDGGSWTALAGGGKVQAVPGTPADGDTFNNYLSMYGGPDPDTDSTIADIGFFGDSLFQFGQYVVDGDFSFYITQTSNGNWIYPFWVDSTNSVTHLTNFKTRFSASSNAWEGSTGGRVYPTSYTDFEDDATDFNITGVGKTDLNLTGFTNLQLGAINIVLSGTVDGRDVSTDGATLDAHVADTSIHTEDALLVHIAGTETITGQKTFSGGFVVDSVGTELLNITRSGTADLNITNSGSGDIVINNSGAGGILMSDIAVTGNITVTGTVDGRDVAADGTAQDSHIADSTIHFTEASIDHTAILNVGTNTHAQIDTHIADSTIHFTQAAISIPLSQLSDVDDTGVATNDLLYKSAGDWVDTGGKLTWDPTNGRLTLVETGAGTNNLQIQVNATNANFLANADGFSFFPAGAGTGRFYIGDTYSSTVTGTNFRVYANNNIDYAEFDNDNIDFNIIGSASMVDLNITGFDNVDITGNIIVSGTVDGRDVAADGTAQDSHIADSTIHFTQAAISIPLSQISDVTATAAEVNLLDLATLTAGWVLSADTANTASWKQLSHTLLSNIGTNTHAQIDTHIADATIHFTEASIDHTAILNVGTNTHAQIDTHIADGTIHFTQGAISIPLSQASDVTITTIASGELLKWNGAAWINNTLAEAGVSAVGHTHVESDITDLGAYLENVVEDTSPTLGGNLAAAGFNIDALGDIDFGSSVGIKASWYGSTYTTGVEANTLYHRASTNHRWYIGVAADGGVSDSMELNAAGLYLDSDATLQIGDGTRSNSIEHIIMANTGLSPGSPADGGLWYSADGLQFYDGTTTHTLTGGLVESDNATITGTWTFEGTPVILKNDGGSTAILDLWASSGTAGNYINFYDDTGVFLRGSVGLEATSQDIMISAVAATNIDLDASGFGSQITMDSASDISITTPNVGLSGNISLVDSGQVILGTSDDAQILFDGTRMVIDVGTPDKLYIRGDQNSQVSIHLTNTDSSSELMSLGYFGSTQLELRNEQTSGTFAIVGTDSGAADSTMLDADPDGALYTYYDGVNETATQSHNAAGNSSGMQVKNHIGTLIDVGFNVMPVYEIDVADTFDVDHQSMLWHKDTASAVAFTCANSTDMPNGATWVVMNDGAGDVTIVAGAGATVYWIEAGGAKTSGTVTVEEGGLVTVYKYSSTVYYVWGAKEAGGGGGGSTTLAALTDTTITSPADAALLLYDTGTATWRDATMSGDATITDTGVITVSAATLADNSTLFNSLASTQFLRSDVADDKTAGDLGLYDSVALVFGTGNDLHMEWTGTYFDITTPSLSAQYMRLRDGLSLRMYDTTDAEYMQISNSLTSFQLLPSASGHTLWLSSNFANIDAASTDADFDAITGTSFGGILSANLLDKSAAETVSGIYTFSAAPTVAASIPWNNNTTSSRDKVRVWNASTYAIGMQNSFTFGGLTTNYAMTFQMSNTAGRGFWWGDSSHTQAQGAMAVTTDGKATIAHSLRLGYGESDTTVPGATYRLDVSGATNIVGALTATSFGGITSANLVDKSATEAVTGNWTFSGASNVYNGIAQANLLDKSAVETVSGQWIFSALLTLSQGSLYLGEKTTAAIDSAGYGQLWTRTEGNGSRLFFTDDTGDDKPVGMAAYNLVANQSSNMTTDTVAQSLVNGAWYSDNATAYTLTLEPSTDTEFPVGAQLTVWNEGSGTLTINEGTSTTLYYMDGSGTVTDTAGGMTLAQGGFLTIIRKSTTVYLAMGANGTA